ncbi:MAG: hypothetical protein AAF938_09245 [Myxococcota bacterium]
MLTVRGNVAWNRGWASGLLFGIPPNDQAGVNVGYESVLFDANQFLAHCRTQTVYNWDGVCVNAHIREGFGLPADPE